MPNKVLMKSSTLVSIIIPSYKRPHETLRAVMSALNQSYDKKEVIVVDDNGLGTPNQEKTSSLLKNLVAAKEIKYIAHDHNSGGNVARNTGVRDSLGEYVALLDNDDEFLAKKIESQLECLLGHSEEGYFAVTCNTCRAKSGKIINYTDNNDRGDFTDAILKQSIKLDAGSTLLIQKDKLIEIGGFDEELKRHQELEFLIRYFRKYKLIINDEVLCKIHIDDRSNIPDPEVFAKNKKAFFDKIYYVFDNKSQGYINKILKLHNLEIVKVCLRKKSFFKTLKYLQKAKASPKDIYLLMLQSFKAIRLYFLN